MTRVRLRTGPTALFLAMFVIALIAFLPMRLALGWFGFGEQGMTARSIDGSIWAGSLAEARFGDVALGDLKAGVSPLQLLIGRARVGLSGRGGTPSLRGAVGVTRHSFGFDDLSATLPVGRIFAPLPVTALELEDVTVHFRDDVCETAEGRVRATMTGDVGGIAVPPSLAGTARCDQSALLLPLTSSGGEGSMVRLWNDGRYRAELTLNPTDPAAAAKLETMGFGRTAQGYQLSIEGRF